MRRGRLAPQKATRDSAPGPLCTMGARVVAMLTLLLVHEAWAGPPALTIEGCAPRGIEGAELRAQLAIAGAQGARIRVACVGDSSAMAARIEVRVDGQHEERTVGLADTPAPQRARVVALVAVELMRTVAEHEQAARVRAPQPARRPPVTTRPNSEGRATMPAAATAPVAAEPAPAAAASATTLPVAASPAATSPVTTSPVAPSTRSPAATPTAAAPAGPPLATKPATAGAPSPAPALTLLPAPSTAGPAGAPGLDLSSRGVRWISRRAAWRAALGLYAASLGTVLIAGGLYASEPQRHESPTFEVANGFAGLAAVSFVGAVTASTMDRYGERPGPPRESSSQPRGRGPRALLISSSVVAAVGAVVGTALWARFFREDGASERSPLIVGTVSYTMAAVGLIGVTAAGFWRARDPDAPRLSLLPRSDGAALSLAGRF